MNTIALFGAGKIGEALAVLLSRSGRYTIKVCDGSRQRAEAVASLCKNTSAHELLLHNESSTITLLQDTKAVISALPYHCNLAVASAAKKAGVHYFDLTEDVGTSDAIEKLSANASSLFMPQCGLAPGFISIAAMSLVKEFETVQELKLRVGALPRYPTNALKYGLTWSTDGLINEYGNPCEILEHGKKVTTAPLHGVEGLLLDGVHYEAFYTSGGLGSLCDTLKGKVDNLNYKTIRYPGHREKMAFLMEDLALNYDRETLKRILERVIPFTAQDKVLVWVEATGMKEGRLTQKSFVRKIIDQQLDGKHFTAIQLTTASGVMVPLDLTLSGYFEHQAKGFKRAEDIPLKVFLAHEFGEWYRAGEIFHPD